MKNIDIAKTIAKNIFQPTKENSFEYAVQVFVENVVLNQNEEIYSEEHMAYLINNYLVEHRINW